MPAATTKKKKTRRKAPGVGDTLAKLSLVKLRAVATAANDTELETVLGPRVAARHPTPEWRSAAEERLAERLQERARRTGEPELDEEQQEALRTAGSRLLGLRGDASPLVGLSDEGLDALRRERAPERAVKTLEEIDPDGGWSQVPLAAAFRGLVLVSASAEAERRWRRKSEKHAARLAAGTGAPPESSSGPSPGAPDPG